MNFLCEHMANYVVNILEFLFFEHVGQSLTKELDLPPWNVM